MSLKDALTRIVENAEGGIVAMIMDSDGISVAESVARQSLFDVQLISVEYTSLLTEVKRAVDVVKAGQLEELSIATTQLNVVMRVLSKDLFVVLIMDRDGNVGKGRYLLQLVSFDLAEELR